MAVAPARPRFTYRLRVRQQQLQASQAQSVQARVRNMAILATSASMGGSAHLSRHQRNQHHVVMAGHVLIARAAGFVHHYLLKRHPSVLALQISSLPA